MARQRYTPGVDSIHLSKPNLTNIHIQTPKPERIRSGGLHDIKGTAKVYGATRKALGQNPTMTAQEQTQRRQFERLAIASSTVPYCNSTTPRGYTCPELSAAPARAGATDAFKLPSRSAFHK